MGALGIQEPGREGHRTDFFYAAFGLGTKLSDVAFTLRINYPSSLAQLGLSEMVDLLSRKGNQPN